MAPKKQVASTTSTAASKKAAEAAVYDEGTGDSADDFSRRNIMDVVHVALAAFAVGIYLNSLKGEFVFDDRVAIEENKVNHQLIHM